LREEEIDKETALKLQILLENDSTIISNLLKVKRDIIMPPFCLLAQFI